MGGPRPESSQASQLSVEALLAATGAFALPAQVLHDLAAALIEETWLPPRRYLAHSGSSFDPSTVRRVRPCIRNDGPNGPPESREWLQFAVCEGQRLVLARSAHRVGRLGLVELRPEGTAPLTTYPERTVLRGGTADSGQPLGVAIVHDYLTQKGGAERVVLALLDAFPGARLYTSVYHPAGTYPEFAAFDVETSWLSRFRFFRNDPRRALPFLAAVFSRKVLRDVDVVICSSSGWAHGVQSSAPKVVYCYNPARWIYQREEYVATHGRFVGVASRLLASALTRWDRRAARSATAYVTLSSVVADRVRQRYGIEAEIVAPPTTLGATGPQEPVAGVQPGFLLTVGRARGYKNVDAVAGATALRPTERLVVVGELSVPADSPNVTVLSGLNDAQMRWLYANCHAVVAAAHEDFGLTPVEGFAFGKPALCLRAGGFLDTMVEGQTGLFFEEPTAAAIAACIDRFRKQSWVPEAIERHAERYQPEHFAARMIAEAELALAYHGLDPVGSVVGARNTPGRSTFEPDQVR